MRSNEAGTQRTIQSVMACVRPGWASLEGTLQYENMLSFGTKQSAALGGAAEHLGWIKVIAGRQTQPALLFTHCTSPHSSFVICCVYVQTLVDGRITVNAVLITIYIEYMSVVVVYACSVQGVTKLRLASSKIYIGCFYNQKWQPIFTVLLGGNLSWL